jgi:hypothetical protein
MYADGLIGNRGVLEVLGLLTAGQFNKMLPSGKAPYKLSDIIPRAHDYINPPLSAEDQKELASQRLLAFAFMNPNAPTHFFEGK